jgi:MFS transporter, PPP family, 3-phenylpropionic acid transporter
VPIVGFYFFYFAAIGIFVPYVPPYLRSLGLSGVEIGALMSIAPLLMMVVPLVWGFLADRTQRVTALLKVAIFGTVLAFAPLVGVKAVWAIGAVLIVHALFFTPITALADTVAISEARRLGTEYARLRLWGSVGFIAASFTFALHLEGGAPPGHAVIAVTALFGGAALVSLALRPVPIAARPPSIRDALRLASDPRLLAFLIAGALHWASAAPYHILFAVHLEDLDVLPRYVGIGLTLAVAAEVGMMWAFARLRRRMPLLGLLALAYAATSARWLLTAFATTGLALAAVQILHGLTFGVFYVASIAHLERTVPAPLLGTGRALFSAVAMGLGGAAGNALAGTLYDLGGGQLAFLAAACLSLAAPALIAFAARTSRGGRRW